MADKIVKLTHAYTVHDKVFDQVVLRAPRYAEYFEIGDPIEMHRDPEGGPGRFVVEHLDRIQAYADRLPTAPTAEALVVLELADAIAVKDAITSFFIEAHRSRKPQTNSSGGQDSQSPPLAS